LKIPITKHTQTKELVELEKEKELLNNQAEKLTIQKKILGEMIDKANEEKKVPLLANLALKSTIPNVEVIKEGSEVEQIPKLRRQLSSFQK
jgi:hypothetical protein